MLLPCYTGMNERLLYFTGSYTCYCSATEEPIHELLLWFRGIYTATALIQRNLHGHCSDTEEAIHGYCSDTDEAIHVLLIGYRRTNTCCCSATEDPTRAATLLQKKLLVLLREEAIEVLLLYYVWGYTRVHVLLLCSARSCTVLIFCSGSCTFYRGILFC